MKYNVVIGCFGGRRGTTIGTLTQKFVNDIITQNEKFGDLEIKIASGGMKHKMKDKENHPIPNEHLAALYEVSDGNETLDSIIDKIAHTGRNAITTNQIQEADLVLSVDPFAVSQYLKQSKEEIKVDFNTGVGNLHKYQTILGFTGIRNPMYGFEMDCSEFPKSFEYGNVVRKVVGMTPVEVEINKALYYSLDGKSYIAHSSAGREAEARDLVKISYKLAQNIVQEAHGNQQIDYILETKDPNEIMDLIK